MQLRGYLDATEPRIVIKHETPTGALDVIRNMDEIDRLLDILAGPEFDTRAEESRAEALHKRLLRESTKVVHQIQTNGQVDQLSSSPTWQAINAAFQQERQRRQRRWLFTGAGVVIVAILLFVVLPRVLPQAPPAPNIDAVSRQVNNGDIQGALGTAQSEQARFPNNPDIALWVGALQLRLGHSGAAETSWSTARKLYGNDQTFYFERGLLLAQLQEDTLAEADAQELIKQPSSAAEGYLLLGGIQEGRGQINQAIDSYQKASTFAEQENNSGLVVAARSRLAYLLQLPPAAPTDVK